MGRLGVYDTHILGVQTSREGRYGAERDVGRVAVARQKVAGSFSGAPIAISFQSLSLCASLISFAILPLSSWACCFYGCVS